MKTSHRKWNLLRGYLRISYTSYTFTTSVRASVRSVLPTAPVRTSSVLPTAPGARGGGLPIASVVGGNRLSTASGPRRVGSTPPSLARRWQERTIGGDAIPHRNHRPPERGTSFLRGRLDRGGKCS